MKHLARFVLRVPWAVLVAAAAMSPPLSGCAPWRPWESVSPSDAAAAASVDSPSRPGAEPAAASSPTGSDQQSTDQPAAHATGAASSSQRAAPNESDASLDVRKPGGLPKTLTEAEAAQVRRTVEAADLPEPIKKQLAQWTFYLQAPHDHEAPQSHDSVAGSADPLSRVADVQPAAPQTLQTTNRLAALEASVTPSMAPLSQSSSPPASRPNARRSPQDSSSDATAAAGGRPPATTASRSEQAAERSEEGRGAAGGTQSSERCDRGPEDEPARAADAQPAEPSMRASAEPSGEEQSDAEPEAENSDSSGPPAPGQWRGTISKAMTQLQQELTQLDAQDPSRTRLEARLRLLRLVAGDLEQALAPIEGLEADEQAYWTHQLHGLHVMLDDKGPPIPSRRAALALRHLRESIGRLASASTLDLRNLTFCSRVDSYGCWTEFPTNRFLPNQEVLLYVEVDNFGAEELPDGFETELQGSYQILDAAGRRLSDHELPLDKQACRDRRRDYFIAYRIYMPKNLRPGPYRLELTIRDVKSDKYGQASADFEIRR